LTSNIFFLSSLLDSSRLDGSLDYPALTVRFILWTIISPQIETVPMSV
jgi:hypothetical protein